MNRALLVLLPGVLGLALAGSPNPGAPATMRECRWCDAAITLDGKPNEPAWSHADVIDRFCCAGSTGEARPAPTRTKARLLWDREYLYLFAEMEDHDLQADDNSAALGKTDALAILLKPADDQPGFHEIQITPAGTVFERFMPKRSDKPPPLARNVGDVEVKIRLDGTLNNSKDRDRGWTLEARIPWTALLRLGGRPEAGETWKFALVRRDASAGREPELSTSVSLSAKDVHRYEEYAALRFAGADARTARPFGIAKRTALTTSKVVGFPDPPLPFEVARAHPKLKINFPIIAVNQPGSDRLLVITSEHSYGVTKLRRLKDDPNTTLVDSEVLLELDDTAYDIAFHPDFAKNGYLYIGSNGPQSAASKDKKTRVTRYTMSPTPPCALDRKSAKLIIDWHSDGHNGGAVAFGHDGMLYVTSGDGTSDSDTNVVGQDMSTLLAKVLRIDVDHPNPGKAYSVPKDNPFVNLPGARPEIWALGLRNPWRMTVDRETGHLWVGQNGQDLWEQAFLVNKSDNYGWSVYEGSHPFYPNRKLGPTPHVLPTVEHPHSEMRSLTGGIVYYGDKHPELRGAYVYGDYSTGRIWAAKHDGSKLLWHKELANTRLQITGFGTDSKGEILIADYTGKNDGGLYRLVRTPKDLPGSTFPKRLSDSGLFRSVKGHIVEPALIPYSVNAPFWSDGVHKQRWLALPGADSTIEFTRSRGWNFPDQTVIVKSFAFDMEEGNPASRRWIETRFLTKQGEWYGYSYEWNDEQTEAVLVPAAGKDREIRIKVPKSAEHPDGSRKQVWHYPSRAECIVCHSRAANYVLGLSEEQMNKEHDYPSPHPSPLRGEGELRGGGVRDNQLRVLEHLGVLRVNWHEQARQARRDEAAAKGLKGKELDEYMSPAHPSGGQRQPQLSSLLAFAPQKYRRLVDPYDRQQDLNLRARSYLHSNCSQCHVEAGGGNAQMELEFVTPLEKMRILNVTPLHHTFDLPDARLVAPGHPERSTLLHRLRHRGPGQMPPLSTTMVDRAAVEMLEEWIRRMKK